MGNQIRCANPGCKKLFTPNSRVKDQQYCSQKDCQRYRKSCWQKQKLESDPDYRANQKRCQKRWTSKNHDYWQIYRGHHPQYAHNNRELQKIRDEKRKLQNLAKMDASNDNSSVKSRSYFIVPVGADLAKMDALSHEVFLIPAGYKDLAKEDLIDFPLYTS